MTYSRDGKCPDCVAVGDSPDLADEYRRYCTPHGVQRERHRKRRNKAVSRARQAGLPDPPPETYTPIPRAHLGSVYVSTRQRFKVHLALLEVRDAENRVRAAMEGTDGYAVGLAAQDLIDANDRLRNLVGRTLG